MTLVSAIMSVSHPVTSAAHLQGRLRVVSFPSCLSHASCCDGVCSNNTRVAPTFTASSFDRLVDQGVAERPQDVGLLSDLASYLASRAQVTTTCCIAHNNYEPECFVLHQEVCQHIVEWQHAGVRTSALSSSATCTHRCINGCIEAQT